mgnify:CR=1 FL=1
MCHMRMALSGFAWLYLRMYLMVDWPSECSLTVPRGNENLPPASCSTADTFRHHLMMPIDTHTARPASVPTRRSSVGRAMAP